jgi:putative DNA primase/helicase
MSVQSRPQKKRLSLPESAAVILSVAETRQMPPKSILDEMSPAMIEIAMQAELDGQSGLQSGLDHVQRNYPHEYPEIAGAIGDSRATASRKDYPCTDLGNAERLVDQFGHLFRYCAELGGFLVNDGKRWIRDRTGQVVRFAKQTIRSIATEAGHIHIDTQNKEKLKWAIESESKKHIDAAVYLAQSDERIAVTTDQFNRDPFLLNCLNGTVDLRTGGLKPHDRADYITKLTPIPFDPEAKCPRWEQALLEIFVNDVALVSYLKRVLGYCTSGDITVQEFYILYGDGANGKNILLDTILHVLAEYARQAEPTLLLSKRNDTHPTGVASLDGARFVSASETDDGKRLDEAMVKRLTGDEKLSARLMHKDFYEFCRTFKVFLATNHRPVIKGKDRGIWRRVRLIPFLATFVKAEELINPPTILREDPSLKAELIKESPGILLWLVQGFQEWQKVGMCPPPAVLEATKEYRTAMDSLASFLEQQCDIGPDLKVKSSELYARYKTHCEQTGVKPDDVMTQTAFGRDLKKRGYEGKHENSGNYRMGLSLRSDQGDLFD